MKSKTLAFLLVIVVIGVFLLGCAQNQPPTGYQAYGGAQGGQQQAYVGGGCGLAPSMSGDESVMAEGVGHNTAL